MDRNGVAAAVLIRKHVALRKESVDRNSPKTRTLSEFRASLSARRAWIEIIWHIAKNKLKRVALRKESVDRNNKSTIRAVTTSESLSARRAWIEI